MDRFSAVLVLALVAGSAATAAAEPGHEKKNFKSRFSSLVKASKHSHFQIKMAAGDDPSALPETATSGPTLVAHGRMGIYEPPLLSPSDMSAVINKHMIDIRRCYKKQLKSDPEWQDDMILDIAVKKTGRVSEVAISPKRVKRDAIGQCLLSRVPKWKFPRFTGEIEEGLVQEVVNASFPLSFSAN